MAHLKAAENQQMEKHLVREFSSPWGPMRLQADMTGIVALYFIGKRSREVKPLVNGLGFGPEWDKEPEVRQEDVFVKAIGILHQFLSGARKDLPIALGNVKGTEFQKKVWAKIALIPYGETITYGQIALSLGFSPMASRAVGAACGANPVPLVVPCHRVVGKDGTLTGFAFGVELKKRLLDLEAAG